MINTSLLYHPPTQTLIFVKYLSGFYQSNIIQVFFLRARKKYVSNLAINLFFLINFNCSGMSLNEVDNQQTEIIYDHFQI